MKHQVKKYLTFLLSVILLSSFMFGLTACSDASRLLRMEESERALELMNVIDEQINNKNSLTMHMSMTMETMMADIKVTATAQGDIYTGGEGTDAYFTHSQTDTTIQMTGEGLDQTVKQTSIQGFGNGKMYASNQTDGEGKINLWSEITSADYIAFDEAYNNSNTPEDFMLVDGSATRTCVQKEDKSWIATYTDFSQEGLSEFSSLLHSMENLLTDVELCDVLVTVCADKNFYPTSVDIAFEFELTDDADKDVKTPTILFNTTFSHIGTTTYTADLSGYTQVDDLRVLTMVDDSLDNFMQAENVEFKQTNRQTLTLKGESMSFTECKEGKFALVDDKFTFDYTYRAQNTEYTVSYKDGTYAATYEGKTEKETITDKEARMIMENLLDVSDFQAYNVKDIQMDTEKSTDTKKIYTLTFATLPDLSEWEEMLDVKLSGDAKVIVTIENGQMTEQEYIVSTTADGGFEIKLAAHCTYTVK